MAEDTPTRSDRRRRTSGRPRTNPRPLAREPRAEILAVASRLFAVHGVGATKMGEIAQEAGLQQSSVYYYFRNKEEILRELVADANRTPLEHLERVEHDGGSAGVRLYRLIQLDVAALCAFPYDINEVHRLSAQDPRTFAVYWRERQALNDGVEAIVREGVRSGEFRPVDPRLTALTLLANDEGVQNWYRPVGEHRLRGRDRRAGGDYAPDEIGAHLADLALRSLLRDRRRLDAIVREADQLDVG
jgi:AcrR family transcriptional regulator